MSEFEEAFRFIIKNEGGFVDNKNDPGGATNYGISHRFLRAFGNEFDFNRNGILSDDIRRLTLDQAKMIYEKKFWKLYDFSSIQSQLVCNYLFDMCVNMGPKVAVKIAQRALKVVCPIHRTLNEDGIMGAKTIAAINQATMKNHDGLLFAMAALRIEHYYDIVKKNAGMVEFLNGWLNRAYTGI